MFFFATKRVRGRLREGFSKCDGMVSGLVVFGVPAIVGVVVVVVIDI